MYLSTCYGGVSARCSSWSRKIPVVAVEKVEEENEWSRPCSPWQLKGSDVRWHGKRRQANKLRYAAARTDPCPFLVRGVANATCAVRVTHRHPPPYLATHPPSPSSASYHSSSLLSPLQISSDTPRRICWLARAICPAIELKVRPSASA
jgi:hypothetical protein